MLLGCSPSTACRHTVSGTISLPSQGFFSPFPHGTGSLSVARTYLALRDGPRGFPQGFSCPAVLRNARESPCSFHLRGYHTLWPTFPRRSTSRRFGNSPALHRRAPYNPQRCTRSKASRHAMSELSRRCVVAHAVSFCRCVLSGRVSSCRVLPLRCKLLCTACNAGFGLFRFRSPLLTESRLLSFPPGTEMVHFPGLARTRLWIQRAVSRVHRDGLPHSEIPGSKGASPSPRLFAGSHVLLRRLAPRHPPYALSSLTIKSAQHTTTGFHVPGSRCQE